MPSAPIHTAGNSRPWEYRPSADRLGSAYHRHGPLVPMEQPRKGWLARLCGRGA